MMKAPIQDKVTAYLAGTLGIEIKFLPYSEAANLPHFLTEAYEIEECLIMGKRFLALIAGDNELTPASIEKQEEWLHQKTGLRGILVANTLPAYNRKRLIERRMPFVVPGNQLYLPDLGLDLHERLKKARPAIAKLSPASQVVVLACILRQLDSTDELVATKLAEQLNYTKMTMSRALDELLTLQLVERQGEGRSAGFRFPLGGRQLWEKARPYLRSPVKKRIYLDEWFPGSEFQAGESALAEKTLLGGSGRATWAVTGERWKLLQKEPSTHMIPEASKEMAHAEFELWRYDPRLLAKPPCVDPLSLALSLSDTNDERMQMAVDELLRGVPW
jgi:DNA-binding transcriptional ArsR family regulator